MRKLLVATHERFASGIMETFKLIMGENEDISETVHMLNQGLICIKKQKRRFMNWMKKMN